MSDSRRDMIQRIKGRLKESASVKQGMAEACAAEIAGIVEMIVEALRSGRKILLCGNGGSAADCQHFAGELMGRFRLDRKGLAALALSTDTSVLTAVANDYDFNSIFSRQVEALGEPGDVLIALSTSGNSLNILEAVKSAKEVGMKTVGMTGGDGGRLAEMVNLSLVVPARGSALIQEGHLTAYHIICELVEGEIFGNSGSNT